MHNNNTDKFISPDYGSVLEGFLSDLTGIL